MQTMEQALADLITRRVVKVEDGLNRSSRKEQLVGLLERAGFDAKAALAFETHAPGLRIAGG